MHSPGRIITTADLAAVSAPLLRGLCHERAIVVACDASGKVIRITRLTDGTTDRSLVPVRDTLALALTVGGTSFGVAHNHPSGSPDPSASDRRVTDRLREAAEAVGLRFLDHVVVTDRARRRVTGLRQERC
ncbi:JAB domain-containing protein [Streptomyces sp. V3I8]|uniref:JAB domain-containing protein n=1 Tax=Streptomyces sp. V3I8 TaxID=3042279 RepID=UPI0035932E4F